MYQKTSCIRTNELLCCVSVSTLDVLVVVVRRAPVVYVALVSAPLLVILTCFVDVSRNSYYDLKL